jgi:sporadic carbohydrate cluster 2OG-Fe(II) oxygenase
MSLISSFKTEADELLEREFLTNGYVIRDVAARSTLDSIRDTIVSIACEIISVDPTTIEPGEFLDLIHERVSVEALNEFRMTIFGRLNAMAELRPSYFSLGQHVVEVIVGNELAMQNQVNLSIQMPGDSSSLLRMHSDSLSGETPYQVVQWLPIVDVYDTKSMYILPPEHNRKVFPNLVGMTDEHGLDGVFDAVRDRVEWLNVPYGKVLVFSPNLLHGNIVNETIETRWSMNSRLTGLFTPYTSSEQNLGTFYLPITTKPASRIGMNYSPPLNFDVIDEK